MLEIIYYCLFGLLLIYSSYFFITSLFVFKRYKKIKKISSKKHKFNIIIAARNEEKVIGNLIDSLFKQNYDKDYYDINVIINNCTDDTLKVVEEHSANGVICTKKVCSKGDVLKFVFSYFKGAKFDAYIIFDADNIVHPDFLKHMNISLNQGYNVAQGYRDSKNYKDNWISGSYTLFYYLQNFFFNLSRKKINKSASINGTGFMVTKEFIEKIDYKPKTLTEDVELTGVCAILNEKIDFVKDAITYDEQPTNFKESWHQRLRWSKGNIECFRYYHHELFKSFFKTGNISCIDMYFYYLAPFVQVLTFVLFLYLLILNIINIGISDLFKTIYYKQLLFFILTYIGVVIVSIFVTIYNHKKVSDIISGILLFMIFIATWIPINIECFLKKEIKWTAVKHNKDIKIDNIISN